MLVSRGGGVVAGSSGPYASSRGRDATGHCGGRCCVVAVVLGSGAVVRTTQTGARRGQGRQLAAVGEDGYRVGRVRCTVRDCGGRGLDGGHGREVLGLGMLSIVVMGVVEGHSR